MADPMKMEQDSWVLPVSDPACPLSMTAVWSQISTFMTTNEWATVAGICRASWRAEFRESHSHASGRCAQAALQAFAFSYTSELYQ